MSKIEAKIIADSCNEFGNRITTMIVTFPRYILAELNTHRMLSKNSASSRAIPFEKLLKSVEENPFIPIAWMKDHKGMQGTEYFTDEDVAYGEFIEQWLSARDNAVESSKKLSEGITWSDGIDSGDAPSKEGNIGVTKQLVNRLLEPFMNHTVIITATEWENFFALRCPSYYIEPNNDDGITTGRTFRSKIDAIKYESELANLDLDWKTLNTGQADIHMMALAEAMWDAYNESTPKELKAGEWHIPFGDEMENLDKFTQNYFENNPSESYNTYKIDEFKLKIATARCARISYTVVGKEDKPANYENDIKLHDRLAASGHWSPFEHCAKAMNRDNLTINPTYESGNFKGFIQYRKMIPNENITK